MLVTEKEASQKICIAVHATIAHLPSVSERNAAILTDADKCKGSRCMAWRWYREAHATCSAGVDNDAVEKRLGYCGLAGSSF